VFCFLRANSSQTCLQENLSVGLSLRAQSCGAHTRTLSITPTLGTAAGRGTHILLGTRSPPPAPQSRGLQRDNAWH